VKVYKQSVITVLMMASVAAIETIMAFTEEGEFLTKVLRHE